MDAAELYRMCDLASSIRKQKGLDANFGMGAKVASLPSNRLGMVYRSCKSGAVNEVILCERDGRYGRLRRTLENGDLVEVIDVTELAAEEGYDLTEDWTEVRLLGNEADQETARAPYNGDPVVDAQWLATYLYHRFYRLPEGVRVTLLAGTHKLGDGTRAFEPLPRRAAAEMPETIATGAARISGHGVATTSTASAAEGITAMGRPHPSAAKGAGPAARAGWNVSSSAMRRSSGA